MTSYTADHASFNVVFHLTRFIQVEHASKPEQK